MASADPVIPFLGETFNISLNWIGKLINSLIGAVGIVGVGIIVFSLILKVIVLPFDVYQRVSMRKQNIKMKENKEKLEKLQKQYANDKKMYSQKMMEMQKENGISMLSSCLPLILSLVFFFVAIGAFNDYSAYANLQNYNLMVNAYNDSLSPYCAELSEDNLTSFELTLTDDEGKETSQLFLKVKDEDGTGEDGEKKYIYYTLLAPADYEEKKGDFEYLSGYIGGYIDKNYYIDVERTYAAFGAEIDALVEEGKDEENPENSLTKETACHDFFVSKAQDNVVKTYQTEVTDRMSFGWIKNIWVTDASYKHPVLDYSGFKGGVSNEKLNVDGKKVKFNSIGSYTDAYNDTSYNVVTAKLGAQKKQANGYYVLIALSIGTILLQQFISMRSQKEQTQFSSVDGQGKTTQKMTLVIMTVMFAIFAFMYSAAFSIYMITSNILSLITTLVINKVVDVVMSKKEEKALQEQYNKRFPGRVYVPEKERNKKDKKTDLKIGDHKKGGKKD